MENKDDKVFINRDLYNKLTKLGIINEDSVRSFNVGISDYSKHLIQPWAIWIDYNLNAFDADIVKRILRKKGVSPQEIKSNRILDYKKIIHICQERIRLLSTNTEMEHIIEKSNFT